MSLLDLDLEEFSIHFSLSISILRHFHFTFHSRSRYQGIFIFQALRYWKILFSPSDFEPTSVRNCQFLTLPVRNCQHADPYQVLGLERSEQQCVLDTRRHQPTPTRCWGLNNLPEDFSNMNCFHFTRCAENLACSKGSRNKLFSPKA